MLTWDDISIVNATLIILSQKPEKFCCKNNSASSKENDVVFDFLGSGIPVVAKTRNYVGIEFN